MGVWAQKRLWLSLPWVLWRWSPCPLACLLKFYSHQTPRRWRWRTYLVLVWYSCLCRTARTQLSSFPRLLMMGPHQDVIHILEETLPALFPPKISIRKKIKEIRSRAYALTQTVVPKPAILADQCQQFSVIWVYFALVIRWRHVKCDKVLGIRWNMPEDLWIAFCGIHWPFECRI